MKILIQHIVVATLVVFSEGMVNPYCDIASCTQKEDHTLCAYPNDTEGDACQEIIHSGINDDERDDIVNFHNVIRYKLHTGLETRSVSSNGNPPGLGYVPIVWDNDLALAAQRWANQCLHFEDECRDMPNYRVSQSIRHIKHIQNINDMEFPLHAWYDQAWRYCGHNYRIYSWDESVYNETVEYTRMIWRNTNRLGCGSKTFKVDNDLQFLLVCNYGPRGNIDGQLVY